MIHTKKTKTLFYGKIATEDVMDKLDMFQAIFGNIDEFVWCILERISADVGTQFTSTEFQDQFQTVFVRFTLAALEYQKINRQVKVTWRTLRTI